MGAFSDPSALFDDIAFVIDRTSFEEFEDGIFSFTQDTDRAFRKFFNELIGKRGECSASDHDLSLGEFFANQCWIRQNGIDMAVVAVELFDTRERRDDALDRVAGEIEVERMFQRGIPFVWRENLDISP